MFMYETLINVISNIIPIDNDDVNLVKSLFKPCTLKKRTVLASADEISKHVYFIVSGYLRYYKIADNGEELTIHLVAAGDFAASFCSFITGAKAEETLHTITDTTLLSIEKKDLEKLYSTDIKWETFGRKLMETFLLEKEKRIIDQISMSAQARYEKLLNTNPSLVQNVPIQYVASYIGIQPESLSRIRKQVFLTNIKY